MKAYLTTILFFAVFILTGQESVKWYTWEEGMMKWEESPKKLLVDLYTDWCGWCKKMDKVTFQNPEIAKYLNDNYIPIKFNAEQKEEIVFKDELHKFVRQGRRGYHALAARLTNGRMSYPTTVFMDADKNVIQAIPGFLDPPKLDPIMRYFADDLHKSVPWNTYLQDYNKAGGFPMTKSGHSTLVNQRKGN